MRNQVFFSYCKKDRQWLDRIQTGLQPLLGQKPFLLWDETKIQAGRDREKEIKKALASAKAAVLLVSPDYLASDYIAKEILPPLLQAEATEGLTILWVAVRKSSYEGTPIARYQPLNEASKPLAALRGEKREDALVSICEQIAEIANQALDEQVPEKATDAIVVHENPGNIILRGEPVPSRTKIQQIIEEHVDVDACFIRQKELEDLFTSVLRGGHPILQGSQGAGKTTLLKQLQKRCEENKIAVGYVDFSTPEGQLQTTLWRNVALTLTSTDPGIIKPEEVERYLDSNHPAPQAVICLDNVDALASNPRIALDREMVHLGSLVKRLAAHHKSTFSVILTIPVGFNVLDYTNPTGSPWYSMYFITPLAEISEQRALQLLHKAGMSDITGIAFCVNTAKFRLPLDLLLLALLVKETTPSNSSDYERIKKFYSEVEPYLRV